MDNISPEVLIYLQSVKHYFNTNKEANDYFIGDGDEDLFFKHLIEISQKNFEKNGEVMLDKEQFEALRITVKVVNIGSKEYTEEEIKEVNIFIDTEFGKICLN
jgi:hypothetical protein